MANMTEEEMLKAYDEGVANHQLKESSKPKLSEEEMLKAYDEGYNAKKPFSVDDLPKFEMDSSPAESALRGAAQGLSYGHADEIAGALESLLTDKPYQQSRDESRENYKNSQQSNPKIYGASEIASSIFSPINKIGLPIKALQQAEQAKKYANLLKLAKYASTGAIQGGVAGAGYGDDLKDIGTGAGIGSAISTALPAAGMFIGSKTGSDVIKNSAKYGGKALQLPELAIDYLSLGLGKLINSIPGIEPLKEIVPGILKNGNASNYKSALAEHYKEIINGMNKYKNIKEELGEIAYKQFKDLNDDERLKVYDAMRRSLAGRGKDAYNPSINSMQKSILSEIEENPEYGKQFVGDMISGKVKEDIAQGVKGLTNKMRVNLDPDKADKLQLELHEMVLRAQDDIDKGIRDRNLNLIKNGQSAYSKKGQFGDILIDLSDADKLNQSEFNPERNINSKSVDKARQNLNDLMMGKKILGLGGLGTEGVSRIMSSGNLMGTIPAATMVMGGAGRAIEKYSNKIRPEQFADSFISNPSILNKISKYNGRVGQLASEALRSMQESGVEGAKSKLFLLATDPDFRRMFNADKANSNPEDQVRSKPWAHDDTP